jgi:glyoxylase-like metal-dependent hydrolase (beta-lactamase superfamily II)
VQRAEIGHAAGPLREHAPFYDKLPGVVPPWLRAWDRIVPVDGDREIAPGVTIIALPGHSPGSQGVLVETAAGRFMLAGDNVNSYAELERRTPPGVIVSRSDWEASMRRIDELDCTVIPSHDLSLVGHPGFGLA